MQHFLLSFNVVFPLALLMAIGFLLRRVKVVGEESVKQFNQVVFRVFLPTMIFKNVYESDLKAVFDPKLILFAVCCAIGYILLLFCVVPLLEKSNAKRGVLIQGIFRSNFVIFGLPIAEALCGSSATGSASVLVAIVIPIFNFAAVITLEIFNNKTPNAWKIIKGILTNPLIIASVLGLAINFFGIRFPHAVETTLGSVASITTPFALILLGASIHFETVKNNRWQLIGGVVAKLILLPAVCLPLAALVFGFRGQDLAILLGLFSAPSAVSSFTMAQQMGGDDELAGQLVMFGTVASVLTMFCWILVVMRLGWV